MHSVKLYWCVKGSQWKPYFLRTFVKSNRVNNISSINLFFKLIDGKQIMGFVTSCSVYFSSPILIFIFDHKIKMNTFLSHNDTISNWIFLSNKLSDEEFYYFCSIYWYLIYIFLNMVQLCAIKCWIVRLSPNKLANPTTLPFFEWLVLCKCFFYISAI